MIGWTTDGPTRFGSRDPLPRWRDALVPLLEDAHGDRPFSPKDPREGLHRATELVRTVGLEVVTIRGSVAVGGVEVDHVWLAVADEAGEPWVLDPAFPLHSQSFIDLLAGYVAGTVTSADLARAAEGLGLADRVIGRFPRGTGYRGEPVWGSGVR